jgi:hypothetical protein
MKRTFLALAMLALILPALPQAKGADVSIDFFYNNISGGNWIEVADYGYGWQPDVATSDPNWRPYADGYWAYTDDGWTWISYEDFGWATYHYGRWARLADYGWVWFPGSDLDWGPAWVSWRTGGDHIGWAPLPPRGPGIAYQGQSIGARVDIEYDIGPEYYNFIDVRFIGEPVLRDRIFPYSQNVTYINNTVNVTNITVRNNVVYNYGPDYNVLSSYSSRPIQRLKLERQTSADLSAAVKTGALTKVQGDKLMVAAPQKITKAAAGVAPPKVKAKVAKPKIEKGWAGVANEAQLKEKIKTENPKNIPPPTRAPATGRAAGAASPAVGASPAAPGAPATPPSAPGRPGRAQPGTPAVSPAGSPAPIERDRGRPGRRPQPGVTATPGAAESPVASPGAPGAPSERGRGRGRPGATPEGVASPSEAASPAASPMAPERGKGKGRPTPGEPPQRVAPPERTAAPETTEPPAEPRERPKRGVASPTPGQPGGAGAPEAAEAARQRGRGPEQAGTPSGPPAGPYESRGRKGRGQEAQPGGPPAGEAPAAAERAKGKPEGGKKKGEKASPTPGGPPD